MENHKENKVELGPCSPLHLPYFWYQFRRTQKLEILIVSNNYSM